MNFTVKKNSKLRHNFVFSYTLFRRKPQNMHAYHIYLYPCPKNSNKSRINMLSCWVALVRAAVFVKKKNLFSTRFHNMLIKLYYKNRSSYHGNKELIFICSFVYYSTLCIFIKLMECSCVQLNNEIHICVQKMVT